MFGLNLDSWNNLNWYFLLAGLVATAIVVASQYIIIRLQRQEARDAVVEIANANAVGESAKADAAKANQRAEQLRADNLALQAGARPRRFSFMGWTTHPERVQNIYAPLKSFSGTSVLIQAVPDFEAQMFAKDIAAVLSAANWNVRFVTETESHMPDTSFAEGLYIFTLSDGKSQTEAGTALWTAMGDAAHQMGAQPFEGAPNHEILDKPKPGYPYFDPPVTAVFLRVGLRQLSSQFLEIQRRELVRQSEDFDHHLKDIVKSGRQLLMQATDGTMVAATIGPDGKLTSSDPNKKLIEKDDTPTLILPNGIMLRSRPLPGQP